MRGHQSRARARAVRNERRAIGGGRFRLVAYLEVIFHLLLRNGARRLRVALTRRTQIDLSVFHAGQQTLGDCREAAR